MKKPKKKVVLWFLAGALIAGMGMTLSMGMAIGSFASALFGDDEQTGSSPAVVQSMKKAAVSGPKAALQDSSAEKRPGVVIRGQIPSGFAANTPAHRVTAPQSENLWENWSPEKALALLSPWPGRTYPLPTGGFMGSDTDEWQSSYPALYDRGSGRRVDTAGLSFWNSDGSPGHFSSGGSSFSSGGGSLTTAGRELTAETTVVGGNVPIPSSVLLLGSGILGLIGFMRRGRKRSISTEMEVQK